jgi:hypothetical protein
MVKTYNQILTQSNLGICKLFYNSNNFYFRLQSNSVLAIWFCDVICIYMYYWPPKRKITNFANDFMSVTHACFFIKEKNLERSTHLKNKLLQPFPLMTCFQKAF